MRAGQILYHFAKGERRVAADARIDFIEDQRLDVVARTDDHLERQHHTTDLAA